MEMLSEEAVEVERINFPMEPPVYREWPYLGRSQPPELDRMVFTVSRIVRREDGVYLTVHTGDLDNDSLDHFFRRGNPIL